MLLPLFVLPLLGLCHAQEPELHAAKVARAIIAGRDSNALTLLEGGFSFEERSPQNTCSVGKPCGDGCMPIAAVCCPDGNYCALGKYCDGGGCCPVGKTCKGTAPPPDSGCSSGQVECGSNHCMPKGSVCCPGGSYCSAGETCAAGMMCKTGNGGNGGSGGSGGNGDTSSVTKVAGYTLTNTDQISFTMPSAPPSLFWTNHATGSPTDNGQSAPTSTASSGNNNPGNPGGKSGAGMVHAPRLAVVLLLFAPLLF